MAHAQFPWLLIWDDHEVVNDWGPHHYLPASRNRQVSALEHQQRQRAAIQAYREYMPIRMRRRNGGLEPRIYGRSVVGDLLELNRLDVRSYRDEPACELDANRHFEPCEASISPERTLLGTEQEQWLAEGLGHSGARWNCLVQATVMAPLDLGKGKDVRHEADSWDNYEAARGRIVDIIRARQLENVVSLGGNIHAFYAGVMYDPQAGGTGDAILSELVTTSVTAGGGGIGRYNAVHGRLDRNPGIQFFENRYRGYLWLAVEPSHMEAVLRVVDDVTHRDGAARTLAELRIDSGRSGVTVP